uniref:Eukaryotic translation initiation factor 3, subunit K n=1 Tax=Salmo trutta TaxID=8032 RepID=A0A673ZN89_SALTR
MASAFEQMRANVGKLLRGIDRYNPENLATLERYVETQVKENAYDLEANLAILKLYQFNPAYFQVTVTSQILLKALTNLPHTDFTLCKCMIDQTHQEERPIRQILYLGNLLETCHFQSFWVYPASWPHLSDIQTHLHKHSECTKKFYQTEVHIPQTSVSQ